MSSALSTQTIMEVSGILANFTIFLIFSWQNICNKLENEAEAINLITQEDIGHTTIYHPFNFIDGLTTNTSKPVPKDFLLKLLGVSRRQKIWSAPEQFQHIYVF